MSCGARTPYAAFRQAIGCGVRVEFVVYEWIGEERVNEGARFSASKRPCGPSCLSCGASVQESALDHAAKCPNSESSAHIKHTALRILRDQNKLGARIGTLDSECTLDSEQFRTRVQNYTRSYELHCCTRIRQTHHSQRSLARNTPSTPRVIKCPRAPEVRRLYRMIRRQWESPVLWRQ